MRTAFFIAGLAFLTGGAFAAQDAMSDDTYTSGQPEAAMTVEDTFTVIDTDADGVVTETEFVAYAGEGSETQFAQVAGDDGLLTVEELEIFMAAQ
jgi:hypothetical protein